MIELVYLLTACQKELDALGGRGGQVSPAATLDSLLDTTNPYCLLLVVSDFATVGCSNLVICSTYIFELNGKNKIVTS